MATTAGALIEEQGTRGDARVKREHAELATQIQALHEQCFGWSMACCGNRREDAEDVLQDVYVMALGDGLTFTGRSTLKTWLFGVIRQRARSRQRRERLREILGLRHAARIDAPAPATAPDDDALASERRARTRHALAQLPQRQREVALLAFYHDLTIEDAARVMRISVGSARVHYDRGKKRLAALLADERP